MSFAKPTGNRLPFFVALPFALYGIAAFTLPPPGQPGSWPLSAVLTFDGLLALSLVFLWPYHRLRRLVAGIAAVFFAVLLAWLVFTGVSELPSPVAFRKLLLGPVLAGCPAYLCAYFALRGRPLWVPARWLRREAPDPLLLAVRAQAGASWTRFLERWPSARAARVQVQIHGQGTPICLPGGAPANQIEFRRAINALTIWGKVLEASPESVRVELRSRDHSLVVGTCEAQLRQVCDWELVMRDGTIEGAYGLRAYAALASKLGTRLPGRDRRRLRRCRPLPTPTSGIPAAR